METLSFYNANATAFVRDFGLMEGLVASCGVSGVAKEIFLARLGVIYQAVLEREMKKGG